MMAEKDQPDAKKTLLRVADLTVRFGSLDIVKKSSFSLKSGQWLMLVGPNGAGKSTLLSALAQLLPYTGRVVLNGTPIHSYNAAARARFMGLLRQDNVVGYAFSVEEIVRLGAYARKRSWLDRDDHETDYVKAAIQKVGLWEQRTQSALTLSGGELQRAFIAQLLVQDPPLMLLDEPTSHLDLKYQVETLDLLADWHKKDNRAIISVVHDLSLAKRYGTHALLLNKGETVEIGPIANVLTDHNLNGVYDMDVRQFMSTMYAQWEKV